MEQARIEALQGTAMFGAIQLDIIAFLLEQARVVETRVGEYFFREGEQGNSAFLLEAGRVSILKAWDGEDQLLRRLKAGDCFGEVALLDFGDRSASVLAEVDCRAIEISAQALQQVAKQDMEQFALIYMNIARELSRRLRDADGRLFRSRFEVVDLVEGYSYASM